MPWCYKLLLLQINDQSLENVQHKDAVRLFQATKSEVRLRVYTGGEMKIQVRVIRPTPPHALYSKGKWIVDILYKMLKVGWRGIFFWLIRISVSQTLPESNRSSYWAGDVVKNTVKFWNSQMNFHSAEIFPCDVNCRKRHHSGSTFLHKHACAFGSQSPTSTTLSHFWLGSKHKHEIGPKAKTNTQKCTEFSLVLTFSLPRNQSEW